MITIKLKYSVENIENKSLILDYQRQYSSCLHYMYNRIVDSDNNISEVELRKLSKALNNIQLLDNYMIQCCIKEAIQIYNTRSKLEFTLTEKQKKILKPNQIEKKKRYFEEHRYKVIFGGKKNYFDHQKGLISKDEWDILSLNPVYTMGDKLAHGNRKFRISQDLNSIMFNPDRKTKIKLNLINIKNRLHNIKKLYIRLLNSSLPITYKLDLNYIYISYEEGELYEDKLNYGKVKNRVLGIDMNPNYIGWSIVDWKSDNEFELVKSGIYNLKYLNDLTKKFKSLKLPSNDPKRIWLSNKRQHETIEIVKNLINKAIHYNVLVISIEDLNIKSEDRNKGKNYNELCNNKWLRNTFVNNITKRCNILGITLLKVKPEYSSFIGNFLFRSYELGLPDMVLSSIELSRRGYEFYNQYIINVKEHKKNIVMISLQDFKYVYMKSLEEFHIQPLFKNVVDLYKFCKEKEVLKRYRLSVNQFPDLQFSRFYSKHSLISVV